MRTLPIQLIPHVLQMTNERVDEQTENELGAD